MDDRIINPLSVPTATLVGIWTESNKLGIKIVSRGKLDRDFKEYHFRLKAKDNPKNINFIKYVGFLASPLHRKYTATAGGYEAHKDAVAKRQLDQARSARDIGALPEVVNPQRKESCERNFQLFCEEYFPHTFELEWSEDHLKAIDKIETSVMLGGLFALAMPRGSGKSSISEIACIWAMLYGHREFVTLIGSTEAAALEMLDSIKTELDTNALLADDFPEVCYPIAQLDGIANRCAGQLYCGERTKITWTANEIVLPTIAGSKSSGIVIRVAGITGRVRGMKYKRADGKTVRPSLVIVDDPQTSESAGSLEQTRKRVRVLAGDILGLAGPGKKISGIMPCTIIRPGDMADIILNRNTHPEWNGEKTKMVYQFPKNLKLWEEYAEIRAESLREDGNIQKATDFYLANREAMDEGAVIAWKERYNHDEASALQHAMNLKLQDEIAFQAEYQNEPMPEDMQDDTLLTVDEIAGKVNGIARGKVPLDCVRITMFIDIQKALLFYAVVAWSDDFTGAVVDYGAWPDQGRHRFSLNDANPTYSMKFPKAGFEGAMYNALDALVKEQMLREFQREDGAMLHIERAMIDANWGSSTDIVYQFCRQSEYSSILYPAHGRYVGASSKPMTAYKKERGARLGFNWYIPAIAGKRAVRHVVFDTNFWKSFIHSRFGVAMGDRGCLSLFGRQPIAHQLFAEHLTAEYRVKTQGLGRTVDEWKLRPQRGDNHWLDCVAGCAVCASMQGSALPEQMNAPQRKSRVRLSDRTAVMPSTESPPPAIVPPPPSGKTASGRMKLSELQKNKKY